MDEQKLKKERKKVPTWEILEDVLGEIESEGWINEDYLDALYELADFLANIGYYSWLKE